jgi:uncharacterized membrane protein
MFHMAAVTRAKAIREVEEPHIKEANKMIPPQQEEPATSSNDDNLTVSSSIAIEPPVPFIWQSNVDSENRPSLKKHIRQTKSLKNSKQPEGPQIL